MTQEDNEIMNAYTVVFDGLDHLGPGDAETTRDIAERLFTELSPVPRIADFGCGVGASTLVLAQSLPQAHVLALDFHAPFVARLQTEANRRGLGERICAVQGDMKNPPPLDGVAGDFDLIWSESAIYNIGRINAFNCWRPLLKPGGWLVFSDIVWQTDPTERSSQATAFWSKEYPDISTADAVVDELTAAGFIPLDPVLSSRKAWSNYYEPLRDRLRLMEMRQNRPEALIDLMTELQQELDIFDSAGDDVAITFFLARKGSIPE
jgi:SAM-dependent methyltransferase